MFVCACACVCVCANVCVCISELYQRHTRVTYSITSNNEFKFSQYKSNVHGVNNLVGKNNAVMVYHIIYICDSREIECLHKLSGFQPKLKFGPMHLTAVHQSFTCKFK